jgi:hypothetical protein
MSEPEPPGGRPENGPGDLEATVAEARAALTDPDRDVSGRHNLGQTLLHTRRYQDALEHFVWLWAHMAELEPEMQGLRVSFLANEIAELCRELPAAHQRFAELRDRLGAEAQASPAAPEALSDRFDWIVLNATLGEAARTLSWFDGLSAEAQEALPAAIVSRVTPMLFERERWADAGRLLRDPLQSLRTHAEMLDRGRSNPMPTAIEPHRSVLEEALLDGLRKEAAQLVRSLKAAGRELDAAAVKREALRLDDSPEMRAALR